MANQKNATEQSEEKKSSTAAKRGAPKKNAKAAPEEPVETLSSAEKLAFVMSIANEKKRAAAAAEQIRVENEIHLTRRPTTRAHGEATSQFPESDLQEFRRRLLDVRTTTLERVKAMKSVVFTENDEREADGGDGTNQTLRLQLLGQIGELNRNLQQIEEALHRIDDGTYGVCTSCGQLIRKPRLMYQPFVLTCMECQEALEKHGS